MGTGHPCGPGGGGYFKASELAAERILSTRAARSLAKVSPGSTYAGVLSATERTVPHGLMPLGIRLGTTRPGDPAYTTRCVHGVNCWIEDGGSRGANWTLSPSISCNASKTCRGEESVILEG